MPISNVCFDLGGVVVRICHSFVEAVEAAKLPLVDPAPRLRARHAGQARERLVESQAGLVLAHQQLERRLQHQIRERTARLR